MIILEYLQQGIVRYRLKVDGDNLIEGQIPGYLQESSQRMRERTGITLEEYLNLQIGGMGNAISLQHGSGLRLVPPDSQGFDSPEAPLPNIDTRESDTKEEELAPDDLAELLVEELQKRNQDAIAQWLSQIQSWLQKQGSLEAAKTGLSKPATLYDKLRPEQFEQNLFERLMLANLAGREEVLDEDAQWDVLSERGVLDSVDRVRADAPRRPEWLRLPFAEAIAHFRQKISIPVQSYKKMEEGYHDWAFSVTGITKGQLLDDARWVVDKAISDGTSFDDFVKHWDRLIGRQGWEPKGDKSRKLYVIYDTNVRGEYGTGRGQQMKDPDVAARRKYILWRHRDSPQPRENHRALHNKAIASDSPFWKKVRFPCGFLCRCGGYAVDEGYVKRHGIEVLKNPPEPDAIAELGFRYPLEGLTGEQRQEIIQASLDRMTPEIKKTVEEKLG